MQAGLPIYKSYLLRYWQERQPAPHTAASWRFSLGDPLTGEREGFSNLEALFRYLKESIQADPKKEGDLHV